MTRIVSRLSGPSDRPQNPPHHNHPALRLAEAGYGQERSDGPDGLSDQARRILDMLGEPGCYGRTALAKGMVSLIGKRSGVSLVIAQVPLALMDGLVQAGLVSRGPQSDIMLYRLAARTEPPGARANRTAVPVPAGHALELPICPPSPKPSAKRPKTGTDSPLMWLARRKDKQGFPMLSPTALAAGERLQQDFLQAGLNPKMGANWSGLPASTGGRHGSALLESERQVAARQRFRRALDACGPDFSGLLLDLCCFLKPLEQVEHERGWPARSGKVVLGMALAALMRHYGLSESVTGRDSARPIRVWRAPETDQD